MQARDGNRPAGEIENEEHKAWESHRGMSEEDAGLEFV